MMNLYGSLFFLRLSSEKSLLSILVEGISKKLVNAALIIFYNNDLILWNTQKYILNINLISIPKIKLDNKILL